MNAVVALCHFCEIHGPKIIFYTQAFHGVNRLSRENRASSCSSGDNSSVDTQACSSPTKSADSCDACRSLTTNPNGLVSVDNKVNIDYVSRHSPESPELYTVLRHACIRSLSCEICPGREGPIVFGDSSKGYVFSYTFALKDVEARGQQKWYSIIIVSKDKIFLINSWNFLAHHIQKIVNELQSKARKVYENEKKQVKSNPYRSTNYELGNFLRKRSGTARATRSLTDLLKDPDIFTQLHLYFTWLLKEGANHFTERLLEGPSETFDNNIIDCDEKYADTIHISSLLNLCLITNTEDFFTLCQHVVIGNQIIIRSSVDSLISSTIDVLQALLPSGCCQVIYKSKEYQDSWKCNFLGLDLHIEIPGHILSSDFYALVDIIPLATNLHSSTSSSSGLNLRFNLTHHAKFNEAPSMMITKLRKLLSEENLKLAVLKQFLLATKQEYMHKAKLLYKFFKTECHTEEEARKLLQILGVCGHDVDAVKFWLRGLSSEYCSHLRQAHATSPSLVYAMTS